MTTLKMGDSYASDDTATGEENEEAKEICPVEAIKIEKVNEETLSIIVSLLKEG